MSLADCRTQMLALLNRRDCNTTLANTFLSQGLARIQRQLRIPSMERAIYENADSAPVQSFLVPADLLQVIDVYANGIPLEKKSYRQIAAYTGASLTDGPYAGVGVPGGFESTSPNFVSPPQDNPRYYARVGASIFLCPMMPQGGQIVMTYFGSFTPLVNDSDENEITQACPELLVYAALSFGGDYFMMDQQGNYEQRFQQLLQETQDEADQLNMTGGPMTLSSPHGCDY